MRLAGRLEPTHTGFCSTLVKTPLHVDASSEPSASPQHQLCSCCSVAQSCPPFVTPWTIDRQAPLSMGLSRQEYWSGLLCPPPGDLPDPGIKPRSLTSPALAGGFFTTRATWEASSPITSWQKDGEKVGTVTDFIFLGSKITVDCDCSHKIKRRLLLRRKAVTNLESVVKSRDITLPTKVCTVKAVVFPVVMYGCES